MKVVTEDLSQGNLKDAPDWSRCPFSCKYCTYWQFPEGCLAPADAAREEMLKKKSEWLASTRKNFGNCGKVLYVDGTPAGYAQYAPASFFPNSLTYSSGPPSDDAVFISCLFISDETLRGLGLGTSLLRNICNELRINGVRAVETFARRADPNNPSGPVRFYLKNGFRIYRNNSEFPLMRLEL